MPIDSVQRSIHIRRKKNAVVFQNIARLWDLGRKAHSHQDILDGLHPWNAPITLRFENLLPRLLALCGIICIVPVFFQASHFWAQLCFLAGLMMIFWAYISYEQDDPIEEVIEFLERESIAKKYQLQFGRQPQHISIPMNQAHFMAHLKNLFPVFNQGSISNDISNYASAVWDDEDGLQHQVLVFQYHYINEIKVRDKDANEVRLKEVHKDLWGVFVFDVEHQGIAITSINTPFYYPYSFPWHSSDIQINQKLKFYGSDEMNTAKLMSPGFVLRAADFFQSRQGDLMFHPVSKILCFLGPQDLFQVSSKSSKIEDISALRGHLRTFKLIALENLQKDLTIFLK